MQLHSGAFQVPPIHPPISGRLGPKPGCIKKSDLLTKRDLTMFKSCSLLGVGGETLPLRFCISAAGTHCGHDRHPGHGRPPGPLGI